MPLDIGLPLAAAVFVSAFMTTVLVGVVAVRIIELFRRW